MGDLISPYLPAKIPNAVELNSNLQRGSIMDKLRAIELEEGPGPGRRRKK